MKIISQVLLCLLISSMSMAQQIEYAEYFYDTDPGWGNGTSISLTAADSIEVAASVPTTSLAPGTHHLFVRVRYTDGVWSQYEGRTFYIKDTTLPFGARIKAAEYFYDTDPGFGNGAAITVAALTDSFSSGTLSFSTTSLDPGVHHLFVRVQDSADQWSLYEGRTFYIKDAASAPASRLFAAEYFYNTDPGLGNGISIPSASFPADSVDITTAISTTGLAPGWDTVYVRVQDSTGQWSQTIGQPFLICDGNLAQPVISGNATVCAGSSLSLSVANVAGATAYLWTGPDNFVSNTQNLDISGITATGSGAYSVVAIRPGETPCDTSAAASITVTVTPQSPAPELSIAADNDEICAGTAVTFTATPTNGGSSPTYQWKKNGTNVGSNSATYSSSTLADDDVITCVLTSNATCVSPASVTSSGITMTVNPVVTPAISIAANNTEICAGTSVTFTATPTNGGSAPAYQWKKNGTNVGTNSATYSSSTLADGDVITCVLTSNAACASPVTVTSSGITMTVNPTVTPAISITADNTEICAGTDVSFTATAMNGGSNPAYQWKKNGANVGTNSATFTSSSLADGDMITCMLTSNAACAGTATVTSSGITVTVNPTVTPAISITADNATICAGTNVNFAATATNGGSNPAYQWKKNGTNIGSNSATYSSSALANGDVITCTLTSNAVCASPTSATGNGITMTVNPVVTPTVSITADNTEICAGSEVSFTATSTNGGNNPAYQWKKDGANVGTNSPTFVTSSLANGDVITCTLTSNAACAGTATVISSGITVTVNPTVTPTISIVADNTEICAGTEINFTATITEGGSSPAYQWKNNSANVGTNSATFTTSTLADGDVITCTLTSNTVCADPESSISSEILITVNPVVTPTISIDADPGTGVDEGTMVTFTAGVSNEGDNPQYAWRKNGTDIPGADAVTYTAEAGTDFISGDTISARLVSDALCAEPDIALSNALEMEVNPVGIDDLNGNASAPFSLYPNPNKGKFVLEGEAPGRGSYSVVITNVLGQQVFAQDTKVTGGKLRIEITADGLAPGTYSLALLKDGERIAVKKFMVRR